jgi:hypothetical protein
MRDSHRGGRSAVSGIGRPIGLEVCPIAVDGYAAVGDESDAPAHGLRAAGIGDLEPPRGARSSVRASPLTGRIGPLAAGDRSKSIVHERQAKHDKREDGKTSEHVDLPLKSPTDEWLCHGIPIVRSGQYANYHPGW